MNEFLKTREQIDNATKYLEENNLVTSGISAKNWEVAQVIPYMKDGDWLDMGSDGGVVIDNLVAKKIKGTKIGVDLAYAGNRILPNGVGLIKGNLTDVEFPDSFFNFITCLSVIEHAVNIEKLAKECARLLAKGGHLFISFDYWQPKPDTSKTKLYSLDWHILDKEDAVNLINCLHIAGLYITGQVDWTLQDAVINPQYCSPADCSYTFGIFEFIKQ